MVNGSVFTTNILAAILGLFFGLALLPSAHADAKYDWSALSAVGRIAIVHPVFALSDLKAKSAVKQQGQNQKQLQELAATLKRTLANRMQEQKRFRVVPDAMVERMLRSLHWKVTDLFVDQGNVSGKQWPQPDAKRLNLLARRLNVDAVLVGEMHAPASIGDSAAMNLNLGDINPLNMGMQRIRPHVISPRVMAYLITVSGIVAWKDEQMADHPRTTPRTERTLLLDWKEATEQVACQIADSLLRLPPPDR